MEKNLVVTKKVQLIHKSEQMVNNIEAEFWVRETDTRMVFLKLLLKRKKQVGDQNKRLVDSKGTFAIYKKISTKAKHDEKKRTKKHMRRDGIWTRE